MEEKARNQNKIEASWLHRPLGGPWERSWDMFVVIALSCSSKLVNINTHEQKHVCNGFFTGHARYLRQLFARDVVAPPQVDNQEEKKSFK